VLLASLIGAENSGKQLYLDHLVPNNNPKNNTYTVIMFNPMEGKGVSLVYGEYRNFKLTTNELPEVISQAKAKTLFIDYAEKKETMKHFETNPDIIRRLNQTNKNDSLYSIIVTNADPLMRGDVKFNLKNMITDITDVSNQIDAFYIGIITGKKELAIKSNRKMLEKPYEFKAVGAGVILPIIHDELMKNFKLEDVKAKYKQAGLI
jgi:tRNA(Met) C34 N-acetyltransferase TmcA